MILHGIFFHFIPLPGALDLRLNKKIAAEKKVKSEAAKNSSTKKREENRKIIFRGPTPHKRKKFTTQMILGTKVEVSKIFNIIPLRMYF